MMFYVGTARHDLSGTVSFITGGGGRGDFWGVSLSFFQGEQRRKGHSSLTQFKGMTIKE